MLCFRRLECLQCGFKRRLNIGSADRNRFGGKFIDRLNEAGFVGRQRAFEKSASGESDESETIARIQLHELLDKPFCMSQTRWLNILRQHGFGCVEHKQKVASLPMHLLNLDAPARTCRRADEEDHGKQENRKPEQTLLFGNQDVIRIIRMFPEKGFQDSGGFMSGNDKNNNHQRHQPKQMP